jgi:hypothetical protein
MTQKKYAKYVNELAPNPDIGQNQTHIGKITEVLEFDKHHYEIATHHIESFIIYAPGAGLHTGSSLLVDTISGKEFRDYPIKLPVDELSLFIGTNPEDPADLGGEVEFWLGEGEEAEKYTITKSSCVHCPAGLVHLPVYFRRVNRPFVFVVIVDSPDLIAESVEVLPPGFSEEG